ncbi:unnamed protein product [Staurois parvus]|uniref:B30.2/SPRY domain-containing protein n=1 Tax=Staurois parvus TaxID=386267 RepID=A0ABN9GWM9_9NEOB|nr:unnamed protein product [Staurois parvus]
MTDPLTVLQESDTGDLCDTEDGDNEDRERHEELLHDGGGLDVARILYAGLSNLITEAVEYFHNPEAADILLDLNTAHNNLHISDDRKTVSWSDMDQNRPETPERFTDYSQVMSSQSFSSGRHYWELEVGKTFCGSFGMCYPSVDRKGSNSLIGRNDKSWGAKIGIFDATFENNKKNIFYTGITKTRIRIYLDYEAGRISFYDLCDPSRHLHTFTTTFTEPLHAGVCVEQGFIKIYGGIPEM